MDEKEKKEKKEEEEEEEGGGGGGRCNSCRMGKLVQSTLLHGFCRQCRCIPEDGNAMQ